MVAEHSKGTLSVVSCDINADGVYDIVTCKVETPGSDITFKFTTFLGDGLGGFQQLAYQWLLPKGFVTSEANYPYEGTTDFCRTDVPRDVTYHKVPFDSAHVALFPGVQVLSSICREHPNPNFT